MPNARDTTTPAAVHYCSSVARGVAERAIRTDHLDIVDLSTDGVVVVELEALIILLCFSSIAKVNT